MTTLILLIAAALIGLMIGRKIYRNKGDDE